jgi:sarcosine oxidase subunit gamma
MVDAMLSALPECARWSLRLPPATAERLGELAGFQIALPINRCAARDERLCARLGPDEWLLCAPVAGASGIESSIEAALSGEHHSLVDVGHRYAAFAVQGAQADVLLAAGCPLDLHPAAFAAGAATRTLMGKAEIVLWRLAEAQAYRLDCARSYAPYVAAFLREAAREFS